MGSIQSYETTGGRRYTVRYRRPDNTQTQKRGFTTKKAAEQYLASVETAKHRGEWMDPSRSKVPVTDIAEEWFKRQVQIKPSTLSGYRQSLDKYVLPKWGRWRLADISHSDAQGWVTELAQTLSPSTVRQVHFVLGAVMKYAIKDGRIGRDPTKGIQLPRKRNTHRGYLSHKQVQTLARACGPHADLITFLAYTGLRWGEMAALRVRSVDTAKRRVEVNESLTDVRGELIRGTPKSHERRSVPYPAFLDTQLKKRMTNRGLDEPLFSTEWGYEMRGNNFRKRVFQPALKRVREADPLYPTVTLHDLRHTAASLAISTGANVKAIQRMLGHASAAMTLDVYADLFDDDLDHVAARLNDAVTKLGSSL